MKTSICALKTQVIVKQHIEDPTHFVTRGKKGKVVQYTPIICQWNGRVDSA